MSLSLQLHSDPEPVLVAGTAAAVISTLARMRQDSSCPFWAAGALWDQAPGRIGSITAWSGPLQLADAMAATGARGLVVAEDDAAPDLGRSLRDEAQSSGLWVRTLPTLGQVLRTPLPLDGLDARHILERHPESVDEATMSGLVAGRRTLVTGAGGSIGSELCAQLARLGPSRLVMVDRDESALHELQLRLSGRALLDGGDTVLADIRDRRRLLTVFARERPELVFHVAALKHLPLLESSPTEAWQTNVHGTINVMAAAEAAGVQTVVNVSTDKAAAPVSVLGASKRTAERVTSFFDQPGAKRLSVRFGNVWASRGSVLHVFAAQIAAGGPVTITHPDVSRYIMTVPEACRLMLHAAALSAGGSVTVLEVDGPHRIQRVAQRLMDLSGRHVPFEYTGLRPGEKLHEDLLTSQECATGGYLAGSPRLFSAPVPPLDPVWLPGPYADAQSVRHWLREVDDHSGFTASQEVVEHG